MADEMVTQQLQELNNKIADLSNKIELNNKLQELTDTVKGLESRIGEQVKANIQTTEAMVKSLVASNPDFENVLSGTIESLKKLR